MKSSLRAPEDFETPISESGYLMKQKLRVSVIIPTKDRVDEICNAIDSILQQTVLPHEIIVIDSSKNLDCCSFIKEKFSNSVPHLVCIHYKASLCAARNIGVEQSSGDILFFFDDDVILDRDYLKAVMAVFGSDHRQRIGGVMGNIIDLTRDTSNLTVLVRRLFFLDRFGDGRFLPSGLPTYVHGRKKVVQTEFLSGCMSAYSRKVLKEFAFDENLGRLGGYCYLEDVDMSYRVSRKYLLVYTPLAKLEHHPSTKGRVDSVISAKQLVINHFYLFKKNIPKRLSKISAFCLSLFGIFLVYGLFARSGKVLVGWFQGILYASTTGFKGRFT